MTRKVPVLAVEDYVKKITVSWRKSVSDILETARLCADARKHLQPKERKELQERLPFGEAAFSMYVKVGSDPWFYDKSVQAHLPPSYSSMYVIALWPVKWREAAIESGALNPGVTRAELEKFGEDQTQVGSPSIRSRRASSHRP